MAGCQVVSLFVLVAFLIEAKHDQKKLNEEFILAFI